MVDGQYADVIEPRVFYPLRRGVLVTDGWFCAHTHRLAIKNLGDVGWRQSTHVTQRMAVRIVLTEVGLVSVIAIVATAVAGPSFLALGLASVHLALVTMVTWLSAYRYPGPLQLWTRHRGGAQILLFSSADRTEFHKIRRALERAIEYNRELAA